MHIDMLATEISRVVSGTRFCGFFETSDRPGLGAEVDAACIAATCEALGADAIAEALLRTPTGDDRYLVVAGADQRDADGALVRPRVVMVRDLGPA